ncbi:hypothetical protein MKW98_016351, partial [Papaver atlanticum]
MVSSVDFSDNLLVGEIPDGIEKSFNLRLNGVIPVGIGGCALLKKIDFSENFLVGGNAGFSEELDGEVPEWIGEMSSLQTLDLSGNALTGGIPESMGQLHFNGGFTETLSKLMNLLELDLLGNSLTDILPVWIFELGLQKVLLSANKLNEDLLQVLGLSDNGFTGGIPSDIEKSLDGVIPMSVGELKKVGILDFGDNSVVAFLLKSEVILSQNNLDGPIPATMADLTSLQTVDLSLNTLCGSTVDCSCTAVLPKPNVFNPNSSSDSAEPAEPGSLSPNMHRKKIILSISALIAIGAVVVIALGVVAVTVLNIHARHISSLNSPTTDGNTVKLLVFSGDPDFRAGAHALLNKDCDFLVKSQEDFEREIKKLGIFCHENLQLHEGPGGNVLSWYDRLNVILGTAK